MKAERGSRVGAILSADKDTVRFLGYGVYVGDFPLPPEFGQFAGWENPKIDLDDGRVVWGIQCWWGDEERVKKEIAGREVVMVNTDGDLYP